MIANCKNCNQEFKSRHGRVFCSQECRKNFLESQKKETIKKKTKNCTICGKEFTGRGQTCSPSCSGKLGLKTFQENNPSLENIAQRQDVKDKIKESYANKTKEEKQQLINKRKEIYNSKTQEEKDAILNKRKETFIKNLGADNPLRSKKVQDKIKATYLEIYGDENPFRTENFKKKASQTWLERYGVDQIAKSKEKNVKTRQTKLKKYGNSSYVNTNKIKQTCQERYGVDNPLQVTKIKEKVIQTNLKRYGVPYNCMTKQCRDASPMTISKVNQEFSKYLNDNNYKTELEFSINKFSYDIHILDTNILIEIDPAYTHNSTRGPQYNKKQLDPKDKYYHYNKTKLALENNYICIHKFNWITKEQVLRTIKKIKTKEIKQGQPRLHWYNMKTRKHLRDFNESYNKQEMINFGYVEIYDDGIIY